jgi:hypothetical protein
VLFGLLIFFESGGAILTGWVDETFIDPTVPFQFIDFTWLKPLPGYGMYVWYVIMAICGLCVMLGFYYRIAIVTFAILWWGSYLMQKFNYNNHYYLLILLSWFMVLMPAHRYASLDVSRKPSLRSLTCPQWCHWAFILQIGIVFFYASINKLYVDWLELRPIEIWFSRKVNYLLVGQWLQNHWVQGSVAYGGILFDLLVVPMLLFRPTRLLALGLSVLFHGFNAIIFQIGIFPFLMIGLTVFFFPPEQIRRLFFKSKPLPTLEPAENDRHTNTRQRLFLLGASIFFLFQLMLPLRHLLFPGNVNWTEEGHRMSWRMMLRTKSGSIYYQVIDAQTGKKWEIDPLDYVTAHQYNDLATHPDLIWQFAQYLKEQYRKDGVAQVQVFAFCKAGLNGRPYQDLIDSSVDLAQVEWEPFEHAKWILPMKE